MPESYNSKHENNNETINQIMVRNTSNLIWYADINSPIKLGINRYLTLGSQSTFTLNIEQLGSIKSIKNIQFTGFPKQYSQLNLIWQIESNVPYTLKSIIKLPNQPVTLYPRFVVEGNDGSNDYWIPLEFRRPIISTDYQPIYDARLAVSNYDCDQWKINPIKELLNLYGFDTSTLGIEVQPRNDSGNELLDSEKEWASSGDCFIAILIKRYESTSGQDIIPGWVHTESGLSYSKNRPTFAFVENSVQIDALYKYLDDNHIIYFDPYNLSTLSRDSRNKIINFRGECSRQKLSNGLKDLGIITLVGFAIYGVVSFFDRLSNK